MRMAQTAPKLFTTLQWYNQKKQTIQSMWSHKLKTHLCVGPNCSLARKCDDVQSGDGVFGIGSRKQEGDDVHSLLGNLAVLTKKLTFFINICLQTHNNHRAPPPCSHVVIFPC